MEGITIYYLLVIVGIFACACSQLLLKTSAQKDHKGLIREMFTWRVFTAYAILFASLLINITAMGKGVNLKDLPILESLGYIFVPVLSYLVLKEKLSAPIIVSMVLILTGIVIFYL